MRFSNRNLSDICRSFCCLGNFPNWFHPHLKNHWSIHFFFVYVRCRFLQMKVQVPGHRDIHVNVQCNSKILTKHCLYQVSCFLRTTFVLNHWTNFNQTWYIKRSTILGRRGFKFVQIQKTISFLAISNMKRNGWHFQNHVTNFQPT